MGGKSMKAMKDTTADNENCSAAEVSSAVSILSGQSGSPRENQDGGSGVTDPAQKDLHEENRCFETLDSGSNNKQGLFSNMITNKLISDFSSGMFHSNVETEIDRKDVTQINMERLSVIEQILVQIYLLSDHEKLLLYLKLTNSQKISDPADPLTVALNLLGNQQEFQQAIVWIKAHLGEIDEKSALKQDIYDQYTAYCRNGSMKALSPSDFGKIMKEVYPEVRPRRLETRDLGTASTAITEERADSHEKKLETPGESPKIPSATVVKDSAPEDPKLSDWSENLTAENKVAASSATELNITNDLNTDGENKDSLSQPLLRLPTKNTDGINYALGKDLDIVSDDVAEVTKNDYTNNKIILNFLENIQVNSEELNVKGADDACKSSEVTSTENVKSAESQPNNFLLTRLPLSVFRRIIEIAPLKRLNGQRTQRCPGRKCSHRPQRSRARRPQPHSQRCRRRRCISIRTEPVNGGTFLLNIQSLLRDKRNEVSNSSGVKEGRLKYFGHSEDTELLGIVGETMVNQLLKLELEKITRNIFSRFDNIRGARNQSSLENTSGADTPAEIAVQGGLPQGDQSSDEYSAEATVTFQNQGNIEYVSNHHLLISNSEDTANGNSAEQNTQSNTCIDTTSENSSVSSSTNYFHVVHIFPGSRIPLLTQETTPFFSGQTAQTMLNNNSLPTNNYSRPGSHFLPLNHGFLIANNAIPPNNNFMSSYNTYTPGNNTDPNAFGNTNTGMLNGSFNAQNNFILGETFPRPMPVIGLDNYSANFHCLNASENPQDISSFHDFSPDGANFNQASMESNFPLPNLSGEIDQLLINQLQFVDPRASVASSQLGPVNSMTGGEFWFPNNSNICDDANNTLGEYSKEQADLFDSNEDGFEPISNCQTEGPVTENEPFPILSLDDLAVDSDDINDQILCHKVVSDTTNFDFDDNSLDTPLGRIDGNNVSESSFSTENMDSYLERLEEPLNQTDSLLELDPGDTDIFDNFLDESAENNKDPAEGTLTLAMNVCTNYQESSELDPFLFGDGTNNLLNECTSYLDSSELDPFIYGDRTNNLLNECGSYQESSELDTFSYGDGTNNQLNEYLGLN